MTYSGNKLVNANNIVLIVTTLFFGAIAFNEPHLKDKYFNVILIVSLFLNTTLGAFYFEITFDKLIVKNYMLPFLNIAYKFSDITEVKLLPVRSYRSMAQVKLKIVRDSKWSMGFRAASLKLKDWQGIVDDLGARRINVTVGESMLLDKIGIPQ